MIYQIIYDLMELFTLSYSVVADCDQGLQDVLTLYLKYASGYANFYEFSDTFAFNFGLMYDSVITGMESFYIDNYFLGGYSVGNIIFLIFFKV
jgi:hypothetical protein